MHAACEAGKEEMNRMLDKKVLQVNMFGGLSLHYDGKRVPVNYSGTSKMMQLFQILLYAGREGIPRNELIERLYDRDSLEDAGATLRVNIYRLRKYIEKLNCFDNADCIWFQEGVYRWNTGAVPLERDTELFENTVKEAFEETDEDRRIQLLTKACHIYRGEFLPELAGEEWVAIESCRFQKIYIDCMAEAAVLLKKQARYEELLELSRQASGIYFFEEYYLMQIDCLMGLRRYKEALEVYQSAASFYFDELGLEPSEEMLERFRKMRDKIHYDASLIMDIKEGLKEPVREGAYFCTYPGFMDSYHVVCRITERIGSSAFLMLCTLTDEKNEPETDPDKLNGRMEKLKGAIQSALRRGDSFTRYGQNQFLILLVGVKQENCGIIEHRINNCFSSYHLPGKTGILYAVYPAAEAEGTAGELLLSSQENWE